MIGDRKILPSIDLQGGRTLGVVQPPDNKNRYYRGESYSDIMGYFQNPTN